jgi:hypothetical protein
MPCRWDLREVIRGIARHYYESRFCRNQHVYRDAGTTGLAVMEPSIGRAVAFNSRRLCGSTIEKLAQASVAGATDGELSSVVENGHVAIFAVGLDARDSFEIHDVRTVNAEES